MKKSSTTDPAPRRLLTAANGNAPTAGALSSACFPEFFVLAERILSGRKAYRGAGLSPGGTRILQAMGYLAPSDLPTPKPLGSRQSPTLLDRAAGIPGCGERTLDELRRWLSAAW